MQNEKLKMQNERRCLFLHFRFLPSSVFLCLCGLSVILLFCLIIVRAQETGGFRLRVKPKVNGKDKGLSRKRFYLIKGSREENKALIEKINQTSIQTRECYYRQAKASEAFINWLKESDCESVYCRPIEEKFVTGASAVPEFQAAFARSAKEYKKPELARLWLTTNLPEEIRDGFYRRKQTALKALIGEAETATNARVLSVMTDTKGSADFTELTPGAYVVTNLLPTEVGDNRILWTCDFTVKADDYSRSLTLSNSKDAKCTVIEKPLPACDASTQTATKR
jgi:hypothetical protein